MDAAEVLSRLMLAIDERRWSDLGQYLHPGFVCRYVHTGDSFNWAEWIALNESYPGFDHLRVQDLVGGDDAAACRSHVTGTGENGLNHFECATFVRLTDGLVETMTEVWTDVAQSAPGGARP
ncbi:MULTISPECIES: hypothetical protein [unclassified Leucobacter]|uniref:hypothetical protein n=1 Tax=unclassified Leucobacter TaxID=2621730 RepID=UPI00165E6CD4|nr:MULTISPECIES: hypothetical protein [unclassified Leucobacter]MBC9936929.1 hypothetical protein [Leucobacter sp. cx-87]